MTKLTLEELFSRDAELDAYVELVKLSWAEGGAAHTVEIAFYGKMRAKELEEDEDCDLARQSFKRVFTSSSTTTMTTRARAREKGRGVCREPGLVIPKTRMTRRWRSSDLKFSIQIDYYPDITNLYSEHITRCYSTLYRCKTDGTLVEYKLPHNTL